MLKKIENVGKWIDKSFDIVDHSKYECSNCHMHVILPGNNEIIKSKCPICKK